MITKANYKQQIERLGFENLPDEIKQAHLVIMTKTDNCKNWSAVDKDKDLSELIKINFQKLFEFISSKPKSKGSLNGIVNPREAAIDFIKPYIDNGDTLSLHPKFKLSKTTDDYSAHIDGDNIVISSIFGEPIKKVIKWQSRR